VSAAAGDARRARNHRRAASRGCQRAGPRRRLETSHGGREPSSFTQRDPCSILVQRCATRRIARGRLESRSRRRRDIREAGRRKARIGPTRKNGAAAPLRDAEGIRERRARGPRPRSRISAETARKNLRFFHARTGSCRRGSPTRPTQARAPINGIAAVSRSRLARDWAEPDSRATIMCSRKNRGRRLIMWGTVVVVSRAPVRWIEALSGSAAKFDHRSSNPNSAPGWHQKKK